MLRERLLIIRLKIRISFEQIDMRMYREMNLNWRFLKLFKLHLRVSRVFYYIFILKFQNLNLDTVTWISPRPNEPQGKELTAALLRLRKNEKYNRLSKYMNSGISNLSPKKPAPAAFNPQSTDPSLDKSHQSVSSMNTKHSADPSLSNSSNFEFYEQITI